MTTSSRLVLIGLGTRGDVQPINILAEALEKES